MARLVANGNTIYLPIDREISIGRAETGGDKHVSRKHLSLTALRIQGQIYVRVRCLSALNACDVWCNKREEQRTMLESSDEPRLIDTRAGGRVVVLSGSQLEIHTFWVHSAGDKNTESATTDATKPAATSADVDGLVAGIDDSTVCCSKEPHTAVNSQFWEQLTFEQQEAAGIIGYTQKSWDAGDVWGPDGPRWDEVRFVRFVWMDFPRLINS